MPPNAIRRQRTARVSSARMKRMFEEMDRLADLAHTSWSERHGIHDMFHDYFNPKHYSKNRTHNIKNKPRLRGNRVSAAMDITNYTDDVLGSAVADHTFAQDCA